MLGTKTKIFRNGEGSSCRVGVSIGIASKDPVKRVRQVFLKILQNSQENICARVSFLNKNAVQGLRKETLTQVIFCEFCKNLRTLFYRTTPEADLGLLQHPRWSAL